MLRAGMGCVAPSPWRQSPPGRQQRLRSAAQRGAILPDAWRALFAPRRRWQPHPTAGMARRGTRARALSEDGCTSADGRPNYPQARSWITPRLGAAPCASQSDDNRKGSTSKRQGAPDGDPCLSGLAGIGGDPDRKGERACALLLRAALCTRGKPDAHACRRQSRCTAPRLHEATSAPS
jgi:hypothetical protein